MELGEEALDLIALRVIEHLEDIRTENGYGNGSGKRERVQPGKQCMLLWAYVLARPRDHPPGWERPRRIEPLLEALSDAGRKRTFGDNECDLVTFVELGDERSLGMSSRDAAAIFFCREESNAVKRNPAGGAGRGRPFRGIVRGASYPTLRGILPPAAHAARQSPRP